MLRLQTFVKAIMATTGVYTSWELPELELRDWCKGQDKQKIFYALFKIK